MKVLNIHSREINQPKSEVVKLLKTLATKEDKIWPKENWPAMKFKKGKKVGSSGGHGPVRYYISEYNPDELIEFQFEKPDGLNGIHKLEIRESDGRTMITHTIDAKAEGSIALLWLFSIRPLHDALIEDAFDKVQLYFSENIEKNKWSPWVKVLRLMLN